VVEEDKMMRKVALVAVVVCLWSQVAAAEIRESGVKESPPASSDSTWSDAGYGSLAIVTNILYMPAKIVYSSLGLVTGSLAYVLTVGDDDTAMSIWSPSLGGTYVVTPSMLRGEDSVLFSGPSHSKN
jgi:hypothetical protein